MALYGIDFYGASRYGPRIFLDFDASPLRADALGVYGQLSLSWTTAAGDWSRLRLIRNSFGIPVDQNDGAVLLDSLSGPAEPLATRAAAVRTHTDTGLEPGSFQYYAIWLYVPGVDEWTRAASATGLVLQDFGYSNRLWELTPGVYRTQTTGLLDNDNETLRSFYGVVGAELDGIRGELETLRRVNDPTRVSGNLLPLMAKQYGQFFEPELGMKQMRKLIRNSVYLYRNKGTTPGVEGFVSAVSGFGATVQPLKNLMLDYNDSSAEESIGRWRSLSNCTLSRYVTDGVINGAPDALGIDMRSAGVLRVTAIGSGNANAYVGTTPDTIETMIPVTAGVQYTASGYVRAGSTGRSCIVQTHFYTITGTYISTSNGVAQTDAVGSWLRLVGTSTAPANAVFASVGVQVSSASPNEVHYFDAFQLEEGATATAFEDARLIDIDVLAQRINLVTNPSFEVNTAGWDATSGNTITRVADTSMGSSYALEVTAGAGTYGEAATIVEGRPLSDFVGTVFVKGTPGEYRLAPHPAKDVAWGYGGTGMAKNAASPPLIDLDDLSAPRILWLPGVAGNYVSTPDVNEVDYDSSTFENSIGRWEGLNKNLLDADDSSFETAAGAYINQVGGTRSRVTTPTFTGAGALALTKNATAGNMSFYTSFGSAAGAGSQPKYQSIVPGQVYTYSAQFRAGTTPRLTRLRLQFFKADHSNSAQAESLGPMVADNSAGWTQNTMTVQAPADARGVALFLDVFDCAAGEVHYVDAVGLFETPNGNLVPDGGDFEKGTEGWTANAFVDNAISTVQTESYTGRSSLRYPTFNSSAAASQTADGSSVLSSPSIPTVVGQTYTVSAYVKRSSTSAGQWKVGITGSYGTASSTAVGVWERITHTFTATSVGTVIRLTNHTTTAIGHQFYVDAVQVVVGSSPVDYLPPSTVNLVLNPSFETNTAGWTFAGSGSPTLTLDTTQKFIGTQSLKAVNSHATNSAGTQVAVDVVAGQTYTLSAYLYIPAAVTSISAAVSNTGYANGEPVTIPATRDAWVRVTKTYTVRAGDNALYFYFLVNAGGTFYIDAVQVETGSVATPYTDGSLGAGYGWDSSSNLVSNPSFETDTAGWQGINRNLLTANQSSVETDLTGWAPTGVSATVARSTAQAFTGSASLALTATSAADIAVGMAQEAMLPVVAGQVYTASAQFRAATVSRGVRIWIQAWGGPAGQTYLGEIGRGPTFADNTAGWNQAVHVFQAPTVVGGSPVTHVNVIPEVLGCAAGEVHYVDAVGLFETPNGNLVPDGGDFEKGTSGFGLLGSATGGVSQEQAYTGRSSYKVIATTTGHVVRQAQISQVINEGSTVSFSSYVKVTSGANVNMVFEYWTAGGAYIGSAQTAFTNVNAWTRLSTTFTLPANAARYDIAFNTQGAATFYVDAVQVVVGSSPVEYLPPNTVNLLLNPSAEVNVSDWLQGGPATIVRSTDQSFVGSASAFLHCNAGTNHIYANVPDPVRIPVTPGATFTGSMYVRPRDNARLVRVAVSCFDTAGNNVAAVTTPATAVSIPAGSWTRVVSAATVIPAGAVTARLTLTVENAATNDGFYLDAVQLELGSVATPYVDGSLGAGYAWEASENLLSAAASSFEDGTRGGWTDQGSATGVTSTEQAYVGTRSQKATWSSAGLVGVAGQSINQALAGLAVGTTYTFSAWVYVPAGQPPMQLSLYWGSNHTSVADRPASAASTVTGAWQRLSVTATAPTGMNAPFLNVGVPAGTTITTGQIGYFDAVQFEQKDYATPYGSTGAAHSSPSKRQQPWVVGGSSVEASGLETGRNFQRTTTAPAARYAHGTAAGLTWFPRYAAPLTAGIETRVNVAPSTTYTLSGNFSGGAINTAMRIVDGTTGAVLSTTGSQGSLPGLRKHALTFTSGPTTTSVRVQFVNADYVTSDSYDNAKYIYVDAVQLEQRTYATAFGSTGAANASTSTRQQPWILGGTTLTQINLSIGPHQEGFRGSLMGDNSGTVHSVARGAGLVVTVAPSTTYTLSAYRYAEASCVLEALDLNTGATLGGVSFGTLGSAGRVSTTFTTSATTTQVRLQVRRTLDRLTHSAWYLDAVQLERGAAASAYTLPTRIVGDLDVRAHVALEDWTQPYDQTLISRWRDADLGRSFAFQVRTTGHLSLYWTADGTSTLFATSTAVVPVADGGRRHLRATLDVDNGASGRTVRFYTSVDGVTWTPLGSDVVSAGVTSVARGGNSVPVHVGTLADNSSILRGKVLSASVRAGIDGTVVAAYDATAHDLSSPNLLRDGLFTTPFGGGNAQGRSSDTYAGGGASYAITRGGDPRYARLTFGSGSSGNAGNLAPGVYTFSAWVKAPSTGVLPGLEVVSGTVTESNVVASSVANGWSRISQRITVGTQSPIFYINFQNGATTGQVVLFDDVQVERGSVATDYLQHPDETLDDTGKRWSITRAGNATAEVVDRSTWAFTGTEYLTLPDRDDLDLGTLPDVQQTIVAGFRTRASGLFGRVYEKALYSFTQGTSLYVNDNGAAQGFVQASTGGAGYITGSGVIVNDGRWHDAALELDGVQQRAWADGTAGGYATHGRTGSLANGLPAYVGVGGNSTQDRYHGLISWVAMFKRVLTAEEHAELAAWDGNVHLEPEWLRTDAVLYLNADDPEQREQYRQANTVANMATYGAHLGEVVQVVGNEVKELRAYYRSGMNETNIEWRVRGPQGVTFRMDKMMVEAGIETKPYFDGSTYLSIGDTIWEGTPHSSRSHYYPQRRTKNYRLEALLPQYTPMGSSFRLNYASEVN